MKSKRFIIDLLSIHEALGWIEEELEAIDFATAQKMVLVAEEAIVNSLDHGYQKKKGAIEISLEIQEKLLIMTIADFTKPCNPLEIATPVNPSLTLEMRKEGGLGVHLMKTLVDKISYLRDNDKNCLIFMKKLPS